MRTNPLHRPAPWLGAAAVPAATAIAVALDATRLPQTLGTPGTLALVLAAQAGAALTLAGRHRHCPSSPHRY